MMDLLADPNAWISLATLTALEIVLGIDNLIFIAVLADRLPTQQRASARRLGLGAALVTRLALLFLITWLAGLNEALFTIAGEEISWRDLVLIAGGLFLIGKATMEIDHDLEGGHKKRPTKVWGGFGVVIAQIAVIDIVFSLDSVITAVGMARHIEVMIAAIVIAILVMLVAAGPVGRFVAAHPTIKMLALSFLILVGMMLVADGIGLHIPKGYLYFAMAFALGVEALNLLARRARAGKGARKRS